ncbi:MAG: hypothetical protein VKO21_09500, partial [Candidatus Sericytochromatia bacterium]|nr:hypothetical protein [Candidatus Sericytochromatia bacterium]
MSPSLLHEVLIELLRQVPEHLTSALVRVLPDLDPGQPVTFVDPAASVPVVVDRRADLVMVFGTLEQPQRALIVEI